MAKKLIKGCAVMAVIALALATGDGFRTTEKGLALIGNAEGCRTQAYQCPAGYWTYGIGTAETSGEKIERNKTYTLQEIADSWVRNIKVAERCVNDYANGRRLPQGAFEASVSLTFNVGCGALKNSTLFRYARAGDIQAMCDQFPRWVYAKGQKLAGLETRRKQEQALCLTSSVLKKK
ncbi:lysozyme [Lonepinella sp. BR2357]|uniref:lysozyme n=1 Tax=Lonepinella sp. BR2357 TaxID=3434549 RepID=UPI003F6DB0E2